MPTYIYVCAKCGHQFEKFQSMKDAALKTCPEDLCARKRWGRGAVRRQLGAGAGLIFKGSGFYITDYRSEGYKSAAQADKPAAPAGETKSGGDKPAAKPAAKPAKAKTD